MSRGGHAALFAASTRADVKAVVADAPAHRSPAGNPATDPREVITGLRVPTLIFHGTADKTVPVQQTRDYERLARDLNRPVRVEYSDGVEHMVTLQTKDRVAQAAARAHAIAFLKEHL